MNYVKDRTYIVTGGAVGLGLETARQLAELGANVVIANTNEARAQEAKAMLEATGAKVEYCVTDITKSEDTTRLMEFTVEKFGRIDGVVNCAGVMPQGEFGIYNAEKWTKCVDINLNGTINVVHAALQVMLKQEGRIPHIVSYASTAAKKYLPGIAIYGATKIAVKWLMDALRNEYPGRVKFSTIYPGPTAGTALGTSAHVNDDDRFFGKEAKPFNIDVYMQDLTATDLDRPFFWGRVETIGAQTINILNQPEGIYIEDLIVTSSNDPT